MDYALVVDFYKGGFIMVENKDLKNVKADTKISTKNKKALKQIEYIAGEKNEPRKSNEGRRNLKYKCKMESHKFGKNSPRLRINC